jgi:hypothetical protein
MRAHPSASAHAEGRGASEGVRPLMDLKSFTGKSPVVAPRSADP